jgi:Type I phosphodiesterase / nucleotide pyrophosphatase
VRLGLVPLLLLLGGVDSVAPEQGAPNAMPQRAFIPRTKFRTVVLILDSVGMQMAFDSSLMPFVSSLTSSSLYGRERACLAKATFPCVKSIFEGRAATTGTTLQDFSAVSSQRVSWPATLAHLGLRLVVTSDHTLTRLYPASFVDHLDVETIGGPILKRDEYAYEKSWQWLKDPGIDVLLLHILGTDKVAHEYPVGGEVYRAKYHEVDDFVRSVANSLGPADYLFVASDHGHKATGGHTEDAVYFARGPIFPAGRHQDLRVEDLLFLLSVPYGLTLPAGYEGQIRTDLTLLPEESRRAFLTAQAQQWGMKEASADNLENKLNHFLKSSSSQARRADAWEDMRRVAPWWFAIAFFLLGELSVAGKISTAQRAVIAGFAVAGFGLWAIGLPLAAWLVTLSTLTRAVLRLGLKRVLNFCALLIPTLILGLWVLPSRLKWISHPVHRPLAFSIFYGVAVAAGLVWYVWRGTPNWRRYAERALWLLAIAVWLFGYFGPYSYSLFRHSTGVVLLILAPLACVLVSHWTILLSWRTVALAAFVPFINFKPQSLDVASVGATHVTSLGWSMQIAYTGLCLVVFTAICNAPETSQPSRLRRCIAPLAFLLAWFCIAKFFFGFPVEALRLALCGAIGLTGLLLMLRKAPLPTRWLALAGAIVLFITLYAVLNQFALNAVDFLFATGRIIPFATERWRAPQIILWSAIKYAFVLGPVLFVLRQSVPRSAMQGMLQLEWWRILMLGLGAFGISLFDPRGLQEQCAEEIYFWLFLAIVVWLLLLTRASRERTVGEESSEATP